MDVDRGFFCFFKLISTMKKNAQKIEDLQRDFAVFTASFDNLAASYNALEKRANLLTEELSIAHDKLLKQSERLSQLLSALPAAVLEIDLENKIISNNPAAQKLFLKNLENKNWLDLEKKCLEKTDTAGEFLLKREKDSILVSVAQSPLSHGKIILIHDISEAEHLKKELERNHRLAAMGEMAASLAHQLRTPLAAALLYTSNLSQSGMSEESRTKFAEKASAQLKRLERFIQDILLFAKGEAIGKDLIEIPDFLKDLNNTIAPLALKENLRFECVDESQNASIIGAKKALFGALINLLENALQATPKGGFVQLKASIQNNKLVFGVRDSGAGISKAMQARIFEPFFTTKAQGTGLGLAIALGVVRAHHGEIAIISDPERASGTTFELCLPFQKSC